MPVRPARPGAFNANFAPDTLEAFKNLCRQQGKAYTKVLEQFAEIYLKQGGAMLDEMTDVSNKLPYREPTLNSQRLDFPI